MKMQLSVVIPAYNEQDNIGACLIKVNEVLKKNDISEYEIIVVNDGSKDKTGEVARSFTKKIKNLQVIDNNPNRGYGGSLRAGFAAAKKEFIVFVPSDNQFDFSEVTKLISTQHETNADIVSGIRVGGGVDPFHRKLNRWGWNTVVRALFGYLATDIDCGFKLFRRSILSHVHLTAERGAMIDTQLFASARARGFKVAEIPLTHLPRTAGKSTGANIRVIIQSFVDLFLFWWRLKKEILVERGLAIFPWEAILLIIILFVGATLRLYKISQYMTFLGDEGRDALVMREMVLGKHFPLIGPGTSIGNMYLGPLYYYLMAPGLAVTNLSPVGPSIEVAVFGLATIALLWWASRQWVGRSSALIIALLYAISPTVIIYSRSSWNPNIMPFFSLLAIYSIWKVWKYGYWRWLVVCAVSIAFSLNSHYLGLLLIPVVSLFWLLRKKEADFKKYTLLSLGIFLLMMSPLVLFDLRHGGQNYHYIKQFFSNRQSTVNLKVYKSLPQIVPLWTEINSSLLTAKNATVGQLIGLITVFGIAISVIRKSVTRDLVFILVWAIVGLIGLGLYKQHIYDHYFGFLFTVPFILFGFAVKELWHQKTLKLLLILIVGILIVINLNNSPVLFPPNNQLLRTRLTADVIKSKSSDQPFNLALLSKSNYDASYRYFLTLNNSRYYTIHEQVTNQLFVICEYKPCEPVGNPLWEIAAFGWSKVDTNDELASGVSLYRLVHNPTGK